MCVGAGGLGLVGRGLCVTVWGWSVGPMLARLEAMWAHFGAMLAQLGPILELCWPGLRLCGPILGANWPILGPSWGYVGLSWSYVGPHWGHVGPAWGYVGPSWGQVGPSWGLCWRILRSMLAHVDPSGATSSERGGKMRRAQNTVKRGSFWRGGVVGGWGGGPSLLRRGENCRTAMPRPGGPWPDLRAAAPAADPRKNFLVLRTLRLSPFFLCILL